MFKFPSFNEQTGGLGMQPKLLCPRRIRFAPGCNLRLQLKADGLKLKVEVDGRKYVKEQVWVENKQNQPVCQYD